MHLLQPVRESVGSVGGVPVRIPHLEKGKAIKIASEWSFTWQRVVQATVIAFPHRRRELDTYGGYIASLFSSTSTGLHVRIISYDEAVRGMVGGGESLSLADTSLFQSLFMAHVLPGGAETGKTTKGGGKGGEGKEVCRRFNNLPTGC